MEDQQVDARAVLQLAAAAAEAAVAGVAAESLAERMSNVFPWMLALSPADQNACAQDLVDAARDSLTTDQPHLVIAELRSWKETATALAAGLGSADLEWLDDEAAESL